MSEIGWTPEEDEAFAELQRRQPNSERRQPFTMKMPTLDEELRAEYRDDGRAEEDEIE